MTILEEYTKAAMQGILGNPHIMASFITTAEIAGSNPAEEVAKMVGIAAIEHAKITLDIVRAYEIRHNQQTDAC